MLEYKVSGQLHETLISGFVSEGRDVFHVLPQEIARDRRDYVPKGQFQGLLGNIRASITADQVLNHSLGRSWRVIIWDPRVPWTKAHDTRFQSMSGILVRA